MLYQILTRTRDALLTPLGFSGGPGLAGEPTIPDPLAHPDVQRMSLRDLADLPLEPFCLPAAREGRRSRKPAANRAEMAAKACNCAVAPL